MPDEVKGWAETWTVRTYPPSDRLIPRATEILQDGHVVASACSPEMAERIVAAMSAEQELITLVADERGKQLAHQKAAPGDTLGRALELENLREANAKLAKALEGALALLEMDGSRHDVWHKALDAGREGH